jgi:hypothetical protein
MLKCRSFHGTYRYCIIDKYKNGKKKFSHRKVKISHRMVNPPIDHEQIVRFLRVRPKTIVYTRVANLGDFFLIKQIV